MQLHHLERGDKFTSPQVSSNQILELQDFDGIYANCVTEDGERVHLSVFATVHLHKPDSEFDKLMAYIQQCKIVSTGE